MKDKLIFGILLIITTIGICYTLIFPPPGVPDIKKFSSEQDFKSYLKKSRYFGAFGVARQVALGTQAPTTLAKAAPEVRKLSVEEKPYRVSKTTVQVAGVDEPDIVKTDGKRTYFSSERYWGGRKTRIVKSFPPENLSVTSKIDNAGNLLLQDNTLVIFSREKIYGYDVSNPKSPDKQWTMELNGTVVGARLYKNKIYMVTKNRIDYYHPCPIHPLSVRGKPMTVRCTEIYHPTTPVSVDVTYNAMVFNPKSGEVEDTISFVGSSGSSVVYMSKDAIYTTYTYYKDPVKIFYRFFEEECRDIIPSRIINRLEEIKGYNLSSRARYVEFGTIMRKYLNSLSEDERMRIQNELSNRMQDYYKEHKRELEKTGIVKIKLGGLEISATGNVPGRPLNQFSLDSYEGNLRIATTVGGGGIVTVPTRVWGESENDVYVLDEDLDVKGSIQGLGLTERVYAVRFLGDKGYVVTFRRIDPFFVIDLSDPEKPELEGKLKIPGYSSYLHPIDEDTILGIGKEAGRVKVSLFDVSSPENPTEQDKYMLDEYWSDILETHHAFLLDKKHKIFFLPGSRGGYVFSYNGSKLELVKTVSALKARRAIYINDYLYIIADTKLAVLNENTWEKVNEIEFEVEQPPVYPLR